ncbi:MAG: arylesterase [Gammaproteobacteria bacterium]|nr:arylesterase [Gammaproteobacteria bacterium]
MLKRLLLLFLLTALPVVAGAAAPTVLVVGDSLSSGYGLEPGRGWVDLLAARLAEREQPYRVVNASISGDTTAGGLRRLPALLETHRPELVLIELGGNDGLRGLPLETVRRNLEEAVRLARATARGVVLIGVRMPPNYGPRYATGFAETFREVAESTGVPLVPALLAGVGERFELMQDDGIHPNAEAQPLIVDNVWSALVPLLRGGTRND